MPLRCTFKNGEDGEFRYVDFITVKNNFQLTQ